MTKSAWDHLSLVFSMPNGMAVDKFVEDFSHQTKAKLSSRQTVQATFYDSFDWRLYTNTLAVKFIRAKPASYLQIISLQDDAILAAAEMASVPAFFHLFKSGRIRKRLEPILASRALLPICTIDYQLSHLHILNKQEKIIFRMTIEEYQQFDNRVILQPLKGYEKEAERIIQMLSAKSGLMVAEKSLLPAILDMRGLRPLHYSSKLDLYLEPDWRSDFAAKAIFKHLLNTLTLNLPGVLDDTDSEFLHDFRVAVRRTRTAISQLKGAMAEQDKRRFGDFFAWLGRITGPTRDFDVYLANFENYKSSLPVSIREDLNPLQSFLLDKKQKAQQEMAAQLRSKKYLTAITQWESYLNEPQSQSQTDHDDYPTIKELADLRIWKNYQRVLQQGRAISDTSNPEHLHELRKTCKKMRYLLEFFHSLYPQKQIKSQIKHLKELQEVLGKHQDYEVQKNNLKQFSNEMLAGSLPAKTFLAMGVLIQNLEANKIKVRKHFEVKFQAYRHASKKFAAHEMFHEQT